MSSHFNLRNIKPQAMSLLKKEATKQKVSVNSLILQIIDQRFSIAPGAKKTIFHDLDHLAGTWDPKDKKEFDKRIKSFEKIDKELWI